GTMGQAQGAVRSRVSAVVGTGAQTGPAGPSRQISSVSRPPSCSTSSTGPSGGPSPDVPLRTTTTAVPAGTSPGARHVCGTASASGGSDMRSAASGMNAAPAPARTGAPTSSVTSVVYST